MSGSALGRTLRAQRLKKFKIGQNRNIQAKLEISNEIENFKRDSIFFNLWALRGKIFAFFLFEPPEFFHRFSRRIFSPHFSGEKVPRKILLENPQRNPPKPVQQKSPTYFCRGGGPKNVRRQIAAKQCFTTVFFGDVATNSTRQHPPHLLHNCWDPFGHSLKA